MFIPYRANVEVEAKPVANQFIIFLTILIYFSVEKGIGLFDTFVLDGVNPTLITHALMHAGWGHLLGNMFYLWLFGNAICSRLGNASYPAIYLTLAATAGIAHMLFNDNGAVGASGAVNGIIGLYLYFYPTTRIHCIWLVWWAFGKKFRIPALFLILFWFVKDFLGAIWGTQAIAYEAHLGGLIAGVFLGWILDSNNWVKRGSNEPQLNELFSEK